MHLLRPRTYLIFPVAIIFLASLVSLASFARAESVLWNKTEQATLCAPEDDDPAECAGNGLDLINPGITINYNVRVVSDATGAVIPSGSIVPQGTVVRYEFIPHVYSDIYWFGTGNNYDTPYGDWIANATRPAGSLFQNKNLFDFDADDFYLYASLSVAPPTKALTGLSSASCTAISNDGMRCTLTPGTVTIQFTFDGTSAHFYLSKREMNPDGEGWHNVREFQNPAVIEDESDEGRGQVYTLQIPIQIVSHTLNVIAARAVGGSLPNTPTLSAGSACVVGQAQTISLTSTDPDGDQLRYGIDWNADGSIDQFVPGDGYVPSGTSQTATRTYAIAGSKTVKVLAQDSNGLSSPWATLSFNCADSTTARLNEGGNNDTGGNGGDITFLLPPAPNLDLRVIPSLVRSGNTTKVNWSATNVQSCTVSAPNGDAWSTLQSILGGNVSKPITGETTYTLSCIDLDGATITKSATVRIIPTFQEL